MSSQAADTLFTKLFLTPEGRTNPYPLYHELRAPLSELENRAYTPYPSSSTSRGSPVPESSQRRPTCFAQTDSDFQNITIGAGTDFGAIGGSVVDSEGGVASSAQSRSEAVALGSSRVAVVDRATGGSGGIDGGPPVNVVGVDGGAAASHATGPNAGFQEVIVLSHAIGGNGGAAALGENVGGKGGAASAGAEAFSLGGAVSVTARQQGGDGAAGRIGGKSPLPVLSGDLEFEFVLPEEVDLILGLTNPVATGDGFDFLKVTLSDEADVLFEFETNDPNEALVLFQDQVVLESRDVAGSPVARLRPGLARHWWQLRLRLHHRVGSRTHRRGAAGNRHDPPHGRVC